MGGVGSHPQSNLSWQWKEQCIPLPLLTWLFWIEALKPIGLDSFQP